MFVWLLSLSILPLLSLAIIACGKKRETAHDKSAKSGKSAVKSGKSGKSKKSKKSQKSKKGKKSDKSAKSGKSGKSSKKAVSSKSKKSKKAAKPGQSEKSAKSAKSGKSTKTAASISSKGSKKDTSQKKISQPKVDAVIQTLPIKAGPTVETRNLELRAEPKQMTYQAIGGIQSVNVVNNTNETRVFKVKCSDNQMYRVHPVFLTIEGGQTAKIEVLRQNGEPKTDKLVLVSVKAANNTGEAKDLFGQGSAQPQHILAVPLIVEA